MPPGTLRTAQGLLPALTASAVVHLVLLAAWSAFMDGWRSEAFSLEPRLRARLSAFLLPAQPAAESRSGTPRGRTTLDSNSGDGADAGSRLEQGDRQIKAPPKPDPGARPNLSASDAASYYPARDLDRHPQIRVHVAPVFPPLALAPTGRVVLRLYVNEAGEVDDIAVESSDSTGAFDVAARQAFSVARFYPGVKNGRPVKSLLRVEVLFGEPPPERTAPDQVEPPDGR